MRAKTTALSAEQSAALEAATQRGLALLKQYGIGAAGPDVSPAEVGKGMDAWAKDKSAGRAAAEDAATAFGALFGGCYQRAGFTWYHIVDDYGEAIALSNPGGIIAFPIDAVRKRLGQPGGGAEIVSVFEATTLPNLGKFAEHLSEQESLAVPLPEAHHDSKHLATPAAFMAALAELGLKARIPESVDFAAAETEWIPVDIESDAGLIRTGFSLSAPHQWQPEPEPLDDEQEAMLGNFMGSIKALFGGNGGDEEGDGDDGPPMFQLTARYAAGADKNETPFLWFAAAALAKIYGSGVADPEADDELLPPEKLTALLTEQRAQFDPAKCRRKKDYPYSLFRAAETGDLAAVLQALESGAPIDAVSVHGENALCTAIRFDHTEVAIALIERGASLKAPTPGGLSALEAAKDSENKQLVTLIKKKLGKK